MRRGSHHLINTLLPMYTFVHFWLDKPLCTAVPFCWHRHSRAVVRSRTHFVLKGMYTRICHHCQSACHHWAWRFVLVQKESTSVTTTSTFCVCRAHERCRFVPCMQFEPKTGALPYNDCHVFDDTVQFHITMLGEVILLPILDIRCTLLALQ